MINLSAASSQQLRQWIQEHTAEAERLGSEIGLAVNRGAMGEAEELQAEADDVMGAIWEMEEILMGR